MTGKKCENNYLEPAASYYFGNEVSGALFWFCFDPIVLSDFITWFPSEKNLLVD